MPTFLCLSDSEHLMHLAKLLCPELDWTLQEQGRSVTKAYLIPESPQGILHWLLHTTSWLILQQAGKSAPVTSSPVTLCIPCFSEDNSGIRTMRHWQICCWSLGNGITRQHKVQRPWQLQQQTWGSSSLVVALSWLSLRRCDGLTNTSLPLWKSKKPQWGELRKPLPPTRIQSWSIGKGQWRHWYGAWGLLEREWGKGRSKKN